MSKAVILTTQVEWDTWLTVGRVLMWCVGPGGFGRLRKNGRFVLGILLSMYENGGAKVGHGSGGMSLLRAA